LQHNGDVSPKETKSSKLIILSLHRASTGDFKPFIINLKDALEYLYKSKEEFLICGDKHTDYLNESNWWGGDTQLASLLTTYNV
jgi:hypothetical protein